jgi:hypothetical protein
MLPLLRGVSFSPKSFSLPKLCFGRWLVKLANTEFALHWVGWLSFHILNQAAFIQDSTLFYKGAKD